MMDTTTYPELIGIRVAGPPPIDEAYIRLNEGLTVLYGRNGAGKSRLLRTVVDHLTGQSLDGADCALHYRWRPPMMDLSGSALAALPGNPWRPESEVLYDTTATSEDSATAEAVLEKWSSIVSIPKHVRSMTVEVLKNLALDSRRTEVGRTALAVLEVVLDGRFASCGWDSNAVELLAVPSEDVPTFRAIFDEIVAEVRESLAGGTDPIVPEDAGDLGLRMGYGLLGLYMNEVWAQAARGTSSLPAWSGPVLTRLRCWGVHPFSRSLSETSTSATHR